ncbi:hypothetical protein [Deinococcus multiflagellatus]|uniref:Uncharacterized protein n=1 Tax=Deinococcus multiflagellatus TaxID=1656887 RepID=A0ABW1ZMP4_9DEIO
MTPAIYLLGEGTLHGLIRARSAHRAALRTDLNTPQRPAACCWPCTTTGGPTSWPTCKTTPAPTT